MKKIFFILICITGCSIKPTNDQSEILAISTTSWGDKYLDIYKSKMFKEFSVNIGTIPNKDSFNIGDTLKLKFYLTDSSFKDIASYHNLSYSKEYFYLINGSVALRKYVKPVNPDTGYIILKLPISQLNSGLLTIGINSNWKNKEGITYDTVFLQDFGYFIKK